jgi:hypothetical protein
MNISCTYPSKGFTKYQSFDEYNLKEIIGKQDLRSAYVYVKMTKDTIEIIKSNDQSNIIRYVNKGEYWYSKMKKQLKKSSIYKSSTIPRYFEKYISDGVIITYSYLVYNNNILDQTLYVDTSNSRAMIVLGDDKVYNETDSFEKFKIIANNYRQTIPYRTEHSGENQTCYYRYYNKVWEDNCLFLYEKTDHDVYKLGCLTDIIKLNSLGEFDLEKGVSIIKDNQIGLCK